jgi:hypothetical protein
MEHLADKINKPPQNTRKLETLIRRLKNKIDFNINFFFAHKNKYSSTTVPKKSNPQADRSMSFHSDRESQNQTGRTGARSAWYPVSAEQKLGTAKKIERFGRETKIRNW